MIRSGIPVWAIAYLAGCSAAPMGTGLSDGGPSDPRCDAGAAEACAASDGGDDAGRDADGSAAPSCASGVLCGSPVACCDTGNECIQGECRPSCPSGVRCGDGLDLCCAAANVCVSGACREPGVPCRDSFDCRGDGFCEPTIGRCLPQFEPLLCQRTPTFGDFATTLEWSATEALTEPTCVHPITTPLVIDLDGDALPEVVVNMACADSWTRGVLRAYRGVDGTELWSAGAPADQINGRVSIAAGDLTGSGAVTIIALSLPPANRVLAFDAAGGVVWRSHNQDGTPLAVNSGNGAPTVADLDRDGRSEIVWGATVLDADGALAWQRDGRAAEGTNATYSGGISAVADIDNDMLPDVVTGRRAYTHDGTLKWTAVGEDGYPAIANFDSDAQAEVVIVADGGVRIVDGVTGEIQWGPVALPGGGRGGPPTIADFDGDGKPEIGVAGAARYAVFDPDGSDEIAWTSVTQDESSNATGSSVFDFEGDGVAEVVYADECYVRVYRGRDGHVLLRLPSTSATIHEYPVVADVDGDGNSEIVVVANNPTATVATQCRASDPTYAGSRHGLFVYGDAADQWVGTRRLWNQHAYHVTNVEPSGRVPAMERDNFEDPFLNNYRQNTQGEGAFNAPNLTVLALEAALGECPSVIRLHARVANLGALGVAAGVKVAFHVGTVAARGALLATGVTSVPLLPGASTDVVVDVPVSSEAAVDFVAIVDDDGHGVSALSECNEGDNAAGIAGASCFLIF